MDFLPKDPAILVSSVNMLLRDEEFDTLESLCYAFSRDPKQIKEYLYKKGIQRICCLSAPALSDGSRHAAETYGLSHDENELKR